MALEVIIGMACPLTLMEYNLRMAAGQNVDTKISFVGRLIRKIIFYDFPPQFFIILYIGFGLIVIVSFILIPPKSKKSQGKSF